MGIFNMFSSQVKEKPGLTDYHEQLKPKWAALGKQAGLRGLPAITEPLINYIGQIQATYRGLLAEHAKPSSAINPDIAELQKSTVIQQQSMQQQRQRELSDSVLRHQRELDDLPQMSVSNNSKVAIYALTLMIATSEAIIQQRSLQVFSGNSNLTEIVFLIVLIGVFCALPHGCIAIYRATKGNPKRMLILIALGIFITACFAVLASIRIGFINNSSLVTVEGGTTGAGQLKEIHLVGLQLFLFFVSCYVASLGRTHEEEEYVKHKGQIEEKLSRATKQLERVERELQAIPERMLQMELSRTNTQAHTTNMQMQIQAMYSEAVAIFIENNIAFRSSQDIPECFNQPIPPLTV